MLEYQKNHNNILQLNYRYKKSENKQKKLQKQNIFNKKTNNYIKNISQIGNICKWEITNKIILYIAQYYNTANTQTIDQAIALKYTNCCWSIGTIYEKKIIGWNNIKNNSIYDKKISINITLNSLNNITQTNKENKILTKILIPYQNIF